jgi:hypothetical protein
MTKSNVSTLSMTCVTCVLSIQTATKIAIGIISYFAFPIKVEDFEARAEYPGGVVRPYKDQLRWGSHDYLSVNRWVDCNSTSWGYNGGERSGKC